MERKKIPFPVLTDDEHTGGKIVIRPKSPSGNIEPLYMLYYSETSFILDITKKFGQDQQTAVHQETCLNQLVLLKIQLLIRAES